MLFFCGKSVHFNVKVCGVWDQPQHFSLPLRQLNAVTLLSFFLNQDVSAMFQSCFSNKTHEKLMRLFSQLRGLKMEKPILI